MIHAAQALRNKRPLQGNPAVVAAAATAAHMNLTPHADTTQCKATQPSNASACTTSSTKGSRWFGAPYRSTTTRAAPSSHPPLMALQNDGGGGMAGRGAAMVVLNTSGGGGDGVSGSGGDGGGCGEAEAIGGRPRRRPGLRRGVPSFSLRRGYSSLRRGYQGKVGGGRSPFSYSI